MPTWIVALSALVARDVVSDPTPTPTLPDYRYFRALSVDLLGRVPTRDELAALERPDFRVDAWIDAHLGGAAYAERLRRIYMDLLRLESSPTTHYDRPAVSLRHGLIEGPHGKLDVYYRNGQRRTDPLIDGTFCFTIAETGLKVVPDGAPQGQARPITQQLLDARTVEIKPWWLYADYRERAPHDRAGPDWTARYPGLDLFLPLFVDPDQTPTTTIRVCREEAQQTPNGRIVVTGQVPRADLVIPPGRWSYPPFDSTYAQAHVGEVISCLSGTGFQSSPECGCGVGLERCIPNGPAGFSLAVKAPLGVDTPFLAIPRTASSWLAQWWAEEAKHFLDDIFASDRDVRDLLTSPGTMINGPLAQFYRALAGATCCGTGTELGYAEPEPLFEPDRVPAEILPIETARWTAIPDRGPHAAGLLTMPVFLMKYGPRRARAHVLSTAFLCKDFVAEAAALTPSTEPDLTRRPGCASCHTTLEPMAAYFARVTEADWTYLPPRQFPLSIARCAGTYPKKPPGCNAYYDPAFATATSSSLRGAYAAPAHADAGPVGLAEEITRAPEFAACVVQNVAQSLLGRSLTPADDRWKIDLAQRFVDGGYRMRALVRAILTSPRYRDVNDRKPAVPR
ncbi:MAG: DUF1585 domain-containing protein [Proteobacteria bacterium]|nr:DUF1585 domain-containing protein [Pseudomonadota bacterium]